MTILPITPGVWRSAQPVTTADWDEVQALGVTQIIKLNTEGEGSESQARLRGIKVFACPIPFICQFATEPDLQSIRDLIPFITDGTLIHCTHGQDRTGLVCALYRMSCGWSKQQAEDEMMSLGFHPELFGLDKAWADLSKDYE